MKRSMNDKRKGQLLIISILFIGVTLISIPVAFSQGTKPAIKIGIMYPFTGPEAFLGKRQLRGWEIALEKRNYRVGDREIKTIVEDDKSDPSTGVTKVNKLIQFDQVHILGGLVNSAVAYAVRDVVHQNKIPLVITMANAGALTRERRSPYIFRTFVPGGTASHYMADFIYNDLKLRKTIFTAADYAYGREHAEMFKARFEQLGGQVLFQNFSPLGTADFGPYCTELGKYVGKADALHFVYSGADAIRFVKTAEEYGLNKKFAMTNWGATEDGSMLIQMKTGAEGAYHIVIYIFDIRSPENQAYLELNKRKGGMPDPLDFYGYVGAEVILRALEKIQGNIEAKDEFLKTLREIKFEGPTGPFEFDPRSQNALLPLYIGQVKKVKGEYGEFQKVMVKVIPKPQDPWWIGR